MSQLASLSANLEDGAETLLSKIRRPRCWLFSIAIVLVLLVAGDPLWAALLSDGYTVSVPHEAQRTMTAPPSPLSISSPPPPPPAATCGDFKCEPPETLASCPSDCPGVTTPAQCGEEPHSDPAGEAVAWGSAPENRVNSAAECCDRCAKHAADPKHAKRPCNSWVFCYMPQCWSLDSGNTHTFGECWLKFQVNPKRPLYGQRGQYTERFRQRHWTLHLMGYMPDGVTKRNLTPPTHVPWTGGVMGTATTYPRVTWTTDLEGAMTSSTGEGLVPWRAWESREQNLKRGVRAEDIPS